MIKSKMMVRLSAAAMVVAAGSMSFAVDRDSTGQGGQYNQGGLSATRVRGSVGEFTGMTKWVPFIISETGPLFNATAAAYRGTVSSVETPVGAITTFSNVLANNRDVLALGTFDGGPGSFGGTSTNAFIFETSSAFPSNTVGTILPPASNGGQATLVWRANFSSSALQNNLEYQNIPTTQTAAPANAGTNKVLLGADTASSTFIGNPGACRDGTNVLVGNTCFTAAGEIVIGTNVWQNANNDPLAPLYSWTQVATPTPAGALNSELRQTQPVLRQVLVNGVGPATAPYICFGVGVSGTTFTGGSGLPLGFVVDQLTAGNYGDGYAYFDADGDNNPLTANNDLKFVDHQATGGGTTFNNSQFDMNDKGQIAVLRVDFTVSPRRYTVEVWNPVWTAGVITGYTGPTVVATSGQDTIVSAYQDTIAGPTLITRNPFAGVSIDNEGVVSFVAATEIFDLDGDPTSVESSTTDVFVWHPDAPGSLFSVARGGQNGDILADNVGAAGPAIQLGFFANDQQSDGYTRESMSDTGGYIYAAFRNGADNDPDIDGGVLSPGGAEVSVRGVLAMRLGEFVGGGIIDCNENGIDDATDIANNTSDDCDENGVPDECELTPANDCNGNGRFDECDLVECPGDVTGDGTVDFADLNAVLSGWETPQDLCGGDANGSGSVDFDDLNVILTNWENTCS